MAGVLFYTYKHRPLHRMRINEGETSLDGGGLTAVCTKFILTSISPAY